MKPTKTGIFHSLALAAVLAVAFFFRIYNIGAEGYGNAYYASTVFSMMTNWKNFFFASFDPASFVSVDKPPFGFWVQAASAALFGFQGWALMLPQIVSGVLACLVLYWLVRRFFGPNAGLLAALILAITPIAVAADRNNTIDGQLLLVLLLSAAALTLAVEKGSLKWLALGAVLIGVGFNIKMLQAYMILPAFYGLYLLAARTTLFKRFIHLAVASVILLGVSFAWVAAVDSTPADQRPYVGSSENNTVTELIEGHNGLRRMGQIASWLGLASADSRLRAAVPQGDDGQNRPVGQVPPNQGIQPQGRLPPRFANGNNPNGQTGPQNGQFPPRPNDGNFPNQGFAPQDGGPNNQTGQGPLQNETGQAGPLRLFSPQLAGQVTWLIPLALGLMLVLFLRNKLTWPLHPEAQFALFWGLWLIPMIVFFSYAGLFHRYYLEMLAPAVAALTAGGLTALARDFAAKRWLGWLLPLGIVASAVFEAVIMAKYWPEFTGWAVALTLVLGGLAGVGLLIVRAVPALPRQTARALVLVGLTALLIAPVLWATTPLTGGDAALPYAGPELLQRNNAQRPDGGAVRARSNTGSPALIEFLEANYNGETFLVAGMNANAVAPVILSTGKAAMAIGGFTGSDPILSADEFAQYVAEGKVRFVLSGGQGGRPNGGGNDVITWVQNSCSPVTGLNLNNGNPQNPQMQQGPGNNGGIVLYDCKK
jgi:4-amino-4-deoxy-L-arabinose transferase-like glycosyltransferase